MKIIIESLFSFRKDALLVKKYLVQENEKDIWNFTINKSKKKKSEKLFLTNVLKISILADK